MPPFQYIYIHKMKLTENRNGKILHAAASNRKQKTEGQTIFLNPYTVRSSCKRQFLVCLFDYEEANRGYPCANILNGKWTYPSMYISYCFKHIGAVYLYLQLLLSAYRSA
jgi:hypothetical protein